MPKDYVLERRQKSAAKDRRIAELTATLRSARSHLVTLGGELDGEHGDAIQRAVLNAIDVALGESTTDRSQP